MSGIQAVTGPQAPTSTKRGITAGMGDHVGAGLAVGAVTGALSAFGPTVVKQGAVPRAALGVIGAAVGFGAGALNERFIVDKVDANMDGGRLAAYGAVAAVAAAPVLARAGMRSFRPEMPVALNVAAGLGTAVAGASLIGAAADGVGLDRLKGSDGWTTAGTAAGLVLATAAVGAGVGLGVFMNPARGIAGRAIPKAVGDIQRAGDAWLDPAKLGKAGAEFHDNALGGLAPGSAKPVVVYGGFGSGPNAQEITERMVRQLELDGGFNKSQIAVFSTTGTGWVNPVAVQTRRDLAKGDIALMALQYSDKPSSQAFTKVTNGAEMLELLLRRVNTRLNDLEAAGALPNGRPKVTLFGESLAAQVVKKVAARSDLTKDLGVDGVTLIGMPRFGQFPTGGAAIVGREALDATTRQQLADRAIRIYKNADDPIPQFTRASFSEGVPIMGGLTSALDTVVGMSAWRPHGFDDAHHNYRWALSKLLSADARGITDDAVKAVDKTMRERWI